MPLVWPLLDLADGQKAQRRADEVKKTATTTRIERITQCVVREPTQLGD